MRVTYAMVFVSDMDRSVAFYRDVVGLALRFQSPGWTEFATEGATLARHLADGPGPAAAEAHGSPAGHCRPGLGVPDLEAFHQRMLAHQVPCIQEPTLLHGSKVAQYADPDGLVFPVGETPEGATSK